MATPATNAVQGQLLTGDGTGAFTASTPPTNTSTVPSGIPNGLWPNILSGDFNGDEVADLAYSLTGTPGSYSGPGLYVQYGVGDGTFAAPVAVSAGQPSGNHFYGESAVGYFDKSGNAGIANIDASYDDTLLGLSTGASTGVPFSVGLNQPESNTNFNQVAAGYFKTVVGQTGNQDLVFQHGANLVPYVNSGDGIRFAPQTALTGPSPAANYAISTVLLTDMDGDGNGDIVALYHNLLASDLSNPSASTANWLYIWFGNGDGTFTTPPQKVSLSRNFYLAAVADMNGDTLPDIVLSDGYVVSILYNQSGGIFQSDFNTCKGGLDCAEAHFLAGQGINSLTLESVRGSTVPDLVVANGGATISNAVVLEGTSARPISLTPNPADVNTGGITVLLNNITALPPTGTLKANPEPSTIGEAFTITATLTPTPGVAAPTGLVAFSLDGIAVSGCSSIPVVTVANTSTAQCPVPIGNTYAVGTYLMTAFYGGDPNNAVATLNGTHNIQGIVTNTVLALCIGGSSLNCPVTGAPIGTLPVVTPLSMTYGQVYNGTETVTDQDGSAFAGTGSIDFYQDNVLLCTLQALGTIPCPPNVGTGTPAGTHVYVSVYSGDSTYTGSTSTAVTIIVGRDTPTVTVSSSQNPAPSGQAVMLTAKLIGTYAPLGTPASPVGQYLPATGTVVFMNGSTTLCSSPLAADSSDIFSTATCTTSTLPVGTDQITASYAAGQDINFFGATSTAFSETITTLNTPDFTVSATPNPTSVGVGYAALMTVTVTRTTGSLKA